MFLSMDAAESEVEALVMVLGRSATHEALAKWDACCGCGRRPA